MKIKTLPNDYECDDDDKKKTTTKKARKLCYEKSIHASHRYADDNAQRDWNLPILYQEVIPDNYECEEGNDKK